MSEDEKKETNELTADQLEEVAGGLANADCESYVKVEPTSVEYPNFTVKKKQ